MRPIEAARRAATELEADGYSTHVGAAEEPVVKVGLTSDQEARWMYENLEENAPQRFTVTMTGPQRFQVYFHGDE